MKAILEFHLPEEDFDFDKALRGKNLHFAILEFDGKLRNWIKHGHEFSNAEEALSETRNFLYKCLNSENINLHD